MSTWAEMNSLCRVRAELTLTGADLEKNHEEEVSVLRGQVSDQVSVKVDSALSMDVAKILSDIRSHYQVMAKKNGKDTEAWFTSQIHNLDWEVAVTQSSYR